MVIKTASLPADILTVIRDKGTERPFTGEYNDFGESGTYLCRQCGLPLFRSTTKFHSACGWPSFDEDVSGSIIMKKDVDGHREEILCRRCLAHLGHVFSGENFTSKNTRHCVNSVSLDFVPDLQVKDTEEAIFAAGCFWGVEYYFKRMPGVLKTEVGYSGGRTKQPSYEDICKGDTGHFEVIRVVYDTDKTSFEQVVKYFFEIHDPTQKDGQGPDKGEQYLSVIFFYNESQKNIALNVIAQLTQKGYSIATQVLPVKTFWRAETYHQDYYEKMQKQPYCHHYEKKF